MGVLGVTGFGVTGVWYYGAWCEWYIHVTRTLMWLGSWCALGLVRLES